MRSAFEDAMGSSSTGQRIVEADAPDVKTAMTRVEAKRRAAFDAAVSCQLRE